MTILYESQESSSPVITRTVANSLLGKSTEVYQFSKLQRLALRVIGQLPASVAEWLVPRVNSTASLKPSDVEKLRTKDLVSGRLKDYQELKGKFPAITIGIGMGGTTAHLALALRSPFLPQAFVLTLKKGTMNGNVKEYHQLTHSLALKVTENNPDLMTIQHYDPVHDGWLVKRVNHLRLKLIDLPEEYKSFIKDRLEPGGDVVYLEGNAQWKRFRTGKRNVFQVGGWGDIGPDEFIYGSQRLVDFSNKEKLDFSHWCLDGFPIENGPESEWGSEPGLAEAIESFCNQEGYNFVKISFDDPNDFTRLAFKARLEIIHQNNLVPSGVVVEMFSQFDTEIVDNTTLLPLWLIFNTFDSLRFLQEMKTEFPKELPVFFSGLSTFSSTPDLVPWAEWENALSEFMMVNIGTRKSHYPADTLALLDWKKNLKKWNQANPDQRIKYHISGNDLLRISDSIIRSNSIRS